MRIDMTTMNPDPAGGEMTIDTMTMMIVREEDTAGEMRIEGSRSADFFHDSDPRRISNQRFESSFFLSSFFTTRRQSISIQSSPNGTTRQ